MTRRMTWLALTLVIPMGSEAAAGDVLFVEMVLLEECPTLQFGVGLGHPDSAVSSEPSPVRFQRT